MVNGQTRGRGRGAVWKWVSGTWHCLAVGYGDVGREDRARERRGKKVETAERGGGGGEEKEREE